MKQFIDHMALEIQRKGLSIVKKDFRNYFSFLIFLLILGIPAITFSAPPAPPTGLCFQTEDGVMQCTGGDLFAPSVQAGVFPGTNLKFRPGFIIAANENQPPSVTESKWQALFTSSLNRKVSYRPPGVYGGVARRLNWYRFYVDQNVKPKNPKDHTDPAYDWSLLDAIFTINAVQNEGALVFIDVLDIGFGSTAAPIWLANSPYDGVFSDVTGGASGAGRIIPKYYRFAGPDIRGLTNVGSSPPIMDEYAAFHQAMRNHLVSTGNIDRVMGIKLEETFAGPTFPEDWDTGNYRHGVGLRSKLISAIWNESSIPVFQNSVNNNGVWDLYVGSSQLCMSYPDVKLSNTSSFPPDSRFSLNGVHQKDIRQLIQATEYNGVRENTYFDASVPNPWGYSNMSVAQTPSHIIWALSGAPKGIIKDSKLGQTGDDPPGIIPVHNIIVEFDKSWSPTVSEWHTAIDTFGPPGTFAFPYLPPGYIP